MTFQKLNIPNEKSTLTGIVLYQSWPLQSTKNLDYRQSVFY